MDFDNKKKSGKEVDLPHTMNDIHTKRTLKAHTQSNTAKQVPSDDLPHRWYSNPDTETVPCTWVIGRLSSTDEVVVWPTPPTERFYPTAYKRNAKEKFAWLSMQQEHLNVNGLISPLANNKTQNLHCLFKTQGPRFC